jgi:hypothetical protein
VPTSAAPVQPCVCMYNVSRVAEVASYTDIAGKYLIDVLEASLQDVSQP